MYPLLFYKREATQHIEELVSSMQELLPSATTKMTGYEYDNSEVSFSEPKFDFKEQCFLLDLDVVVSAEGLIYNQREPCKIDRDRLWVGGEWGPIDGRRKVESMRWEIY